VDVREQTYHVAVTSGENGTMAIRVNGRIAAQPLAANESQRVFRVGGAVYKMSRLEGGRLSLELRETAPMAVPTVMAGGESMAASLRARRMVWAFIAVAVVAPFIWYVTTTTYSKTARRRVETVLAGMTTTPDPATLGMWARNTHHLADIRELSWASDNFDRWRREKDLYHKITTWRVLNVDKVKGAQVQTASVDVEIDGRKLRILVPEGRPLTWAE